MINISIKQIFRNFWRNKATSLINLLGLGLGMAAVVMLYLISNYERSFDEFHGDSEHIYRVVRSIERQDSKDYDPNVPYPTGQYIREKTPGLAVTQISYSDEMEILVNNQEVFLQKDVVFADSAFFNVLDFGGLEDLRIAGDLETALKKPNTAILTESRSRTLFGNENPIGQIIRLDNKVDVEIAGIIKDIPATSHLPISMLVSYRTLNDDLIGGLDLTSWNFTGSGYAYVRLEPGVARSVVNPAFEGMQDLKENGKFEEIFLQPLTEIHLDKRFEGGNASYTIHSRYITMLLLLGLFILLIACVNYINLSTAYAFTKAREIGVRKTIGASKKQLFLHYMAETFIMTFFSAVLGILASILLLPTVNTILNKSISASELLEVPFLAGAFFLVILIAFLAGIYPALVLSGFKPVKALKNQVVIPTRSSSLLRKGLVVFQFTISISLIICTLVISRQMNFFHQKELGFNKEAVVEVKLPENDSIKRENFLHLLREIPSVEQVSFGLGAPISTSGISVGLEATHLPEKMEYQVKIIPSDRNYKETYGLKLLAGRWFLSSEEKNLGTAVVINRELAATLGYEPQEAIGKNIFLGINEMRPSIVGVTENFHTSSLHERIQEVALLPFPFFYYAAGVKVHPGDLTNALSEIENAWKKVYPKSYYEAAFVDETLAVSYEQETQNFKIFKAFSAISIFICSIGLWGLISFVVLRRTKEIGIRKVLGASVSGIIMLLSKDFLRLIILALIIASPVAWYFMSDWLQNYAYRIDISWTIFPVAGLFAIGIAFIATGYQALKAGNSNPVKNLRTE